MNDMAGEDVCVPGLGDFWICLTWELKSGIDLVGPQARQTEEEATEAKKKKKRI